MDFTQHVEEQFAWLLHMAKMPGAKAYAWHRAQEMAKCDSGLYRDFDKRLTAAVLSASRSPSAPAAGSTTASTGEPGAGA